MKLSSRITPIGGALDFALREYGLEKGVRERDLFLRWEQIVGAAIAARTEPVRFENGILHVRAEHAVWRQELILRREELRRLINSSMKEPMVRGIVVR